MKLFLIIFFFCAISSFASEAFGTTQVTQQVLNPDGTLASGQTTITLSNPCTLDGVYVGIKPVTIDFTGGAFSTNLVPNIGCLPINTFYNVKWTLKTGLSFSQKWIVPATSPVSVDSVIVGSVPLASQMLSLSQLSSGGASSGNCLAFNGTSWAPSSDCGSGGGGGGTWGTIIGSLPAQTDLQNALNAKQNSLGFTAENVANKSTGTSLGTSNSLYPTQNAVKSYVDTGLSTKQNSLGYTAENQANKDQASGYPSLDSSSKVPVSEIPTLNYQAVLGFTPENVANKSTNTSLGASDTLYPSQKAVKTYADTKQTALGFTPENSANKNAASGYVGLDSSSKIASSQLPNPTSTTLGGVESSAAVSHQFVTQIGTDGSVSKLQPSASDVSGLATVATSGDYRDLTNQPTIPAAQVNTDWNASSGVAQLLNKPSTFTPSAHASTHATGGTDPITPASIGAQTALGFTAENVANKSTNTSLGTSDTLYPTQNAVKTYADTKQTALGFTPENVANKNAASGYAGLDSSSKIASSQIPTLNQNTTGLAGTATALASTPSLCSTGQAPTGVLASGNATSCQTYVLPGPASQAIVGTDANGQLVAPTTPYTSNISGATLYKNPLECISFTVPYTNAAFQTAANGANVAITTVPAKWQPVSPFPIIEETTQFTSGTIASARVSVGTSALPYNFLASSAIMQASNAMGASSSGPIWAGIGGSLSLVLRVETTDGNNLGTGSATNFTAGSLTGRICGVVGN